MTDSTVTLHDTLEKGGLLRDRFAEIATEVAPIARGIRDSEALFVVAAGSLVNGEQVTESGRFLGRSTYLYGRAWPDRRIVSVEADRSRPREVADEALQRVRDLPNVYPLFGDSRRVLTELILPGDVVVIDGPKGFRALRLAHRIMRRTDAAIVFIHDVNAGTAIRAHLERWVPWAFYSDDPQWMELAGPLDVGRGFRSGGTYACIPCRDEFPGWLDTARVWGR